MALIGYNRLPILELAHHADAVLRDRRSEIRRGEIVAGSAAGPTIQIIFPPFNLLASYGDAADRLSEFIGLDVTDRLATEMRNLIVRRTRSGQGVQGTFAGYALSTQMQKGVGAQPVTLTGAGQSLDKLMGKVDPPGDAMVIKFEDSEAEKIFTFHQVGTEGGARMPAREWLGLIAEEELFLFQAMQRIINTQTIPAMERATGLPIS